MLVSIPEELIQKICEFAVITTDENDSATWIDTDSASAVGPPILRTCHVFRRIGLPIFWGKNRFVLNVQDYDFKSTLGWRSMKPRCAQSETALRAITPVHPVAGRINLMAWLKAMMTEDGGNTYAPTWLKKGQLVYDERYEPDDRLSRLWKVFDQGRVLKMEGLSWTQASRVLSLAIDTAGVLGERA